MRVVQFTKAFGIAAIASAGLAVGFWAHARTPTKDASGRGATIPYRGLVEFNGAGIDGQRDFTFELCTTTDPATPGDSCPWSETHADVRVAAGAFAVTLGDSTDLSDDRLGGSRWLQITIIDKTGASPVATRLQGRQLLGSTPYARKGAPGQDFLVDGNVGIGVAAPQAKLHVAGQVIAESGFGYVPLGSILAWHKSLVGTPALPSGWVECNGQVLADAGSPYNGQQLPDLNNNSKFLRGASSSGVMQDDALQGHNHLVPNLAQRIPNRTGTAQSSFDKNDGAFRTEYATTIADDGTHGPPRVASETRPTNMSVVWILRVR